MYACISDIIAWKTILNHQVSLDRCASEDTCILYCTTGILLQRLIQDKNLREFSHIILDEVHDREADMDFCILVIKQLLKVVSAQVRWPFGWCVGMVITCSESGWYLSHR